MNRICILLLFAITCGGCADKPEKTASQKLKEKTKEILVGSWTTKDKSRFLEITEGGSIIINKKDSSSEKIGFYEIANSKIRIYKDKDNAEGRTEVCRYEVLSENAVLFGENEEYWNVINLSGKWYREGKELELDKVLADLKYKSLSPDEKKLADIKKKRVACEQLVQALKGDRENYLEKLAKLDESKQADSWKLNASMLAKTKRRMRDADYELKKLKRAEEALEILIADKDRDAAIKKAGLDEKGLKELLLSIGETENQLPVDDESEFSLKSLVEEEMKDYRSKKEEKK